MAETKSKSSIGLGKKQIVSYEIPASFNPFEMGERIIRVEEELRHQRELVLEGFKAMDKRFEAVDKRFEDMQKYMDKRFEAVDKRFNLMMWIMAGGFCRNMVYIRGAAQ